MRQDQPPGGRHRCGNSLNLTPCTLTPFPQHSIALNQSSAHVPPQSPCPVPENQNPLFGPSTRKIQRSTLFRCRSIRLRTCSTSWSPHSRRPLSTNLPPTPKGHCKPCIPPATTFTLSQSTTHSGRSPKTLHGLDTLKPKPKTPIR